MSPVEDIQVSLNYNRDDGSRSYKFGRPRSKHERLFYTADEGRALNLDEGHIGHFRTF